MGRLPMNAADDGSCMIFIRLVVNLQCFSARRLGNWFNIRLCLWSGLPVHFDLQSRNATVKLYMVVLSS